MAKFTTALLGFALPSPILQSSNQKALCSPPLLIPSMPSSASALLRAMPPSHHGRRHTRDSHTLPTPSRHVPNPNHGFPSTNFTFCSQELAAVLSSLLPVKVAVSAAVPPPAILRPIALGWSARAPSKDFPHCSPELPLAPTSPPRWTTPCHTESPSPAHHRASLSTPTTLRRRAISSSTPGRHTPLPARPSATRAMLLPPLGPPHSRRSILPFSGHRHHHHHQRQVRPSHP